MPLGFSGVDEARTSVNRAQMTHDDAVHLRAIVRVSKSQAAVLTFIAMWMSRGN
jgi:hypothetical protein